MEQTLNLAAYGLQAAVEVHMDKSSLMLWVPQEVQVAAAAEVERDWGDQRAFFGESIAAAVLARADRYGDGAGRRVVLHEFLKRPWG